MPMKIDPKQLPVMKNYCQTCPFKPNEQGHYQDMALANQVIKRTLFQAHQICHGTEGKNRKPHNRCKGAFDHNMEIYQRMGLDPLIE
jgi:hypothetical protein